MDCISKYIFHSGVSTAKNVFVYSYEMNPLGKIAINHVSIPIPQTKINPLLFRKPESAQAFPFCHFMPESLL